MSKRSKKNNELSNTNSIRPFLVNKSRVADANPTQKRETSKSFLAQCLHNEASLMSRSDVDLLSEPDIAHPFQPNASHADIGQQSPSPPTSNWNYDQLSDQSTDCTMAVTPDIVEVALEEASIDENENILEASVQIEYVVKDCDNEKCRKEVSIGYWIILTFCSSQCFFCNMIIVYIPSLLQKMSLKNDLEKVKKSYRTALQTNLYKDLKIQHMENKFKELDVGVNFNDYVPGDFARYTNLFDDKQLAIMRSLDSRQANDAVFLRSALKSLYKEDLSRLTYITVTGRAGTNKISPDKMIRLTEIFQERLDGMDVKEEEKERRSKRLGNVLAKAINTILISDLKIPKAKKKLQYD